MKLRPAFSPLMLSVAIPGDRRSDHGQGRAEPVGRRDLALGRALDPDDRGEHRVPRGLGLRSDRQARPGHVRLLAARRRRGRSSVGSLQAGARSARDQDRRLRRPRLHHRLDDDAQGERGRSVPPAGPRALASALRFRSGRAHARGDPRVLEAGRRAALDRSPRNPGSPPISEPIPTRAPTRARPRACRRSPSTTSRPSPPTTWCATA